MSLKLIAKFATTLAAGISTTSPSMLLSSLLTKKGETIIDGAYGFILDRGLATEETVIGNLVGSTLTFTTRGLSDLDGVTSIPANIFAHRKGATIELTGHPVFSSLTAALDGSVPFTNILRYNENKTFTDPTQLISKNYADGLFTGVIGSANPTTAGTLKTTIDQGIVPRAMSTIIRAHTIPDKTLKVQAFKHIELDKNIEFAGGDSAELIDPGLAGDLSLQTNPTNGQQFTLTINGTACVFTAVSSIGSTIGNFLIGATVAETRGHLAAFINAPGTTNGDQVAFTGAQLTALALVNASDNLTTTIFIKSISPTLTTITGSETFTGANNTWTPNTTNNRIDLVVLQTSDTTVQVRRGTEAVSPVAASPVSGDIVLAQVFCRIGMTYLSDVNDTTNGYILNWYYPSIYGGASVKFGGNGSDGPLVITSGTTTINLGGLSVFTKNYTSISITGTGVLAFTNPNPNGTIIVIKCQGSFSMTSSANPAVDIRLMGSVGGSASTGSGTQSGAGGGGGASANTSGSAGGGGSAGAAGAGGTGSGFGLWITSSSQTGGVGGNISTAGAGGISNFLSQQYAKFAKLVLAPGSGGGGGGGGSAGNNGGAGGRGGGGLFMEVGGSINITGIFNASGAQGSTSSGNAGNSGGGGGGSIVILYNTLIANTGTYTVNGGIAGTGGSGAVGGVGGAGYSLITQNTELA